MPPRVLCICILWLAIGKKQTRAMPVPGEEEEAATATAAVLRLRWQHSRLLHVASCAHTQTLTCRQQHNWRVSYSIYRTYRHTERELVLSQVSVRYIQAHFRMWMWRKKAGCANRPRSLAVILSLSLSCALSHTLSLSDSPSPLC